MSWILGPEDVEHIIFIPSVVLGFVLAGLYCYRCWRRRFPFEQYVLISVFLQSAAFVTGAVLMITTVTAAFISGQTPLTFYAFLSGLTITAVSAQGIYHAVIKERPTASDDEPPGKAKRGAKQRLR